MKAFKLGFVLLPRPSSVKITKNDVTLRYVNQSGMQSFKVPVEGYMLAGWLAGCLWSLCNFVVVSIVIL
jgi:hypothetical protein